MPSATSIKLAAVNEILRALKQAPVTSLTDPENLNASLATGAIDDAVRNICNTGYYFNRALEKTLEPTTDGTIAVPANTLSWEFSLPLDLNPRIETRGDVFWNLETDSNQFTDPIIVNLRILLTFEEIPPLFQTWATMIAKRALVRDLKFDPRFDAMLAEEEIRVKADALRDHINKSQFNMIESNYDVYVIATRRANPVQSLRRRKR